MGHGPETDNDGADFGGFILAVVLILGMVVAALLLP